MDSGGRGRGRGRFMRGGRGGGGRGGYGDRGGFGGRGGGMRGRGRGRGGGGGFDDDQRSSNPTKLHVTNLPEDCNSKELEELFDSYGKVVECDIVRDFAFVHYRNAQDAKQAVENLNGHEWKGATLNVRHSTSTLRQKPGAAVGDCFRCGGRGHRSQECPSAANDPRSGGDRYSRPSPYGDPYSRDRFMRAPFEHPFFDPYARDQYIRRRLPPVDPYDPFLADLADPIAARKAFYARADALPASRDPYGRPPPEFYQRRGRGGAGAYGNGKAYAGGDADGLHMGESAAMLLDGNSYSSQASRPANDPYFFSDDYDKGGFQSSMGLIH